MTKPPTLSANIGWGVCTSIISLLAICLSRTTSRGEVSGYKRELNISDAVTRTVFEQNGVQYEREIFASPS